MHLHCVATVIPGTYAGNIPAWLHVAQGTRVTQYLSYCKLKIDTQSKKLGNNNCCGSNEVSGLAKSLGSPTITQLFIKFVLN